MFIKNRQPAYRLIKYPQKGEGGKQKEKKTTPAVTNNFQPSFGPEFPYVYSPCFTDHGLPTSNRTRTQADISSLSALHGKPNRPMNVPRKSLPWYIKTMVNEVSSNIYTS